MIKKLKDLLRRRKFLVLLSAAILIVVLISVLSNGDKQGPSYEVLTVTLGNIQPTVLSTGTVSPENRLEIKPPIAGRIDNVIVHEGDVIKKGSMLVSMSSTERAALLDAASAQGISKFKQWEAYYKPAPIMAPIDGTIIVRSVEPGQTVTGSDVILVISDRLTVKARVDETDIGSIKLNQKADITLDAYPDDVIPGVVDKIAYDSKIVSNITTYIVDVLPDTVPEHMRSGMTANVTFYLDSKNGVLTLPSNAVRIKDQKSFVLLPPVISPIQRSVTTGISDGVNIEILSGLKEGDKVLIEKLKWTGSDDSQKSNPFFPSKPKAKKSQ